MLGGTARGAADRVDSRTGVRERVAFVPRGPGDEQVFMCSYEPAGEPIGGVLICSSILPDFLANYQREVNLARSLAAAGLSVVRFHYSGNGNSDGSSADVTLSSLEADACWAAQELARWLPDRPVAFVGTRWGVLSAAAAAHDESAAPLVLCEPVTDFSRYFQDALRVRAMSAIATGKSRKGARQLSELLARDGYVDIVGNVIHQALFDSTIGVDPGTVLATGTPHPGLLVQFGGTELRGPNRALEQQLVDSGWKVETKTVDVVENWWFKAGVRTQALESLNDVLVTWLVGQLQPTTHLELR